MQNLFRKLLLIAPKMLRPRKDPGYSIIDLRDGVELFIRVENSKFATRTGIFMDLMPLAKVSKIYKSTGDEVVAEFDPCVTFAGTAQLMVGGKEEKVMMFKVPKEMQPDDLKEGESLYFGFATIDANRDHFFKNTNKDTKDYFKPIFEGYYD